MVQYCTSRWASGFFVIGQLVCLNDSATAPLMGNYAVLQVAYAGVTGAAAPYSILATYYSASTFAALVVAVPYEGIYSAVTRSDFDSNAVQSVVALAAGLVVNTIPSAAVLADNTGFGVRIRGFVRGPMKGAAVYTFTVALNAVSRHKYGRRYKCDACLKKKFSFVTPQFQATDRSRAWVDNVSRKQLFCED